MQILAWRNRFQSPTRPSWYATMANSELLLYMIRLVETLTVTSSEHAWSNKYTKYSTAAPRGNVFLQEKRPSIDRVSRLQFYLQFSKVPISSSWHDIVRRWDRLYTSTVSANTVCPKEKFHQVLGKSHARQIHRPSLHNIYYISPRSNMPLGRNDLGKVTRTLISLFQKIAPDVHNW